MMITSVASLVLIKNTLVLPNWIENTYLERTSYHY
jgi:hypothetical protein